MGPDAKFGYYQGIQHSKTFKHSHSTIEDFEKKFKVEASSPGDTKEIVGASTFDEGSTFTLKQKDEHVDQESDVKVNK